MEKKMRLGLRLRMLLLILVAMLPGLILAVITVHGHRNREKLEAQDAAIRLAHIIAVQEEDMIDATRQLLIAISHGMDGEALKSPNSTKLLAHFLGDFNRYLNIGICDGHGNVVSSAVPLTEKVNLSDRLYFREAMKSGDFSVGEYQVGRITGKPSINFGYPIKNERGRIIGVVFAAMSLEKLGELEIRVARQLPRGATITKVDKNGILLAQFPDGMRKIGVAAPEWTSVLEKFTENQGIIWTKDQKGEPHLFAYSQISSKLFKSDISVVLSMPERVALSRPNYLFYRNLLGLVVTTCLILMVGAFLNEVYIVRGMNSMQNAAQQIAGGDLRARITKIRGMTEVRQLARAFNEMANSLEQRETERREAEAALAQSEQKFRLLIENAPEAFYQVLLRHDSSNGRLIFVSPQIKALTGRTPDEFLSNQDLWHSSIHPDDLREVSETNQLLASQRMSVNREYRLWDVQRNAYRWVADHASPRRDQNNNVVGYQAVLRDITEKREAEEALRASERRYKTLAEASPVGIFRTDTDGKTTYVNKRWCELAQMSFSEAIGDGWLAAVHPEDRDRVVGGWKSAYPQVSTSRSDYRFLHKDGTIVTVIGEATPEMDANGKAVGYVGTITDITDQKKIEEALRESEAKYRLLIENQTDLIVKVDLEGRFVFVSPSYCKVFGKSENELLGKSYVPLVHEDDRQITAEAWDKLFEPPHSAYVEQRAQAKDGWRWIAWLDTAVLDERGKVIEVIGVGRDVTERKEADERLLTLSRAVEQSPSSVIVTDPKGVIRYVNPKFTRVTGYTFEEVAGKKPSILKSGRTTQEEYKTLWSTILSGNEWHGEFCNKKKNGELYWESASISPIKDQNGKILFLLAVKEDITERKRSEELNLLLAQTLKSARDMISVTDLQNNILFVNDAFLKGYGYTESELTGQPIMMVNADAHPNSASAEIRTATLNGGWHGELVNRRKDGAELPIELWTSVVREPNGAPLAMVGVARDISQRKASEEALHKSEIRYRGFFDDDLTADFVCSPDGDILECNPAFIRLFEFASPEHAKSTTARKLFPSNTAWLEFVAKLTRERRLDYHEIELRSLKQKPIYAVENIIGTFDERGNLSEIKGYIFDDTRRRKLEQQLLQSQKLESLGTLASGIAHDFNNILGIIMVHSSFLTHENLDPPKITRSVDAISNAAQRGATLVKQLLTFARKSESLIEPIQAKYVVREIVPLVKETFPKTITVASTVPNDLPLIAADPNQLHQVLINLCVNARDAMTGGGSLTITAGTVSGEQLLSSFPQAKPGAYLELKVADTGIGMDDATRQRIFDPFFTTKEVGKGTGLGLAMVYGIVESHGGFIDVRSELGHGTTFRIYLPVAERGLEKAPPPKESLQNISGGTETILLVEDEATLSMLLKTILTSKGYTVLSADDGEEACKIYREHKKKIALVISDIGLPRLNGEEVFKRIREMNPKAKVVLASGFVEPDKKSDLLKAGVAQFILKPYSPADVLKIIRQVIGSTGK